MAKATNKPQWKRNYQPIMHNKRKNVKDPLPKAFMEYELFFLVLEK